MIPFFDVPWSDRAIADWMRLSYGHAEAVARAVKRYGDTAEGMVIYTEGEYRPFVGGHVVIFLLDADTMHVDRVRRS